jgi:spoIIIJ-associated protein
MVKKVQKKVKSTMSKKESSVKEGKSKIITLSEKTITKLLDLIGIKSKAEVLHDAENDCIKINIKADEEAGLLIGRKGETINSLQKFMVLSLRNSTGEWHRVIVNVADWREKQQLRLEELAAQAATRARETGEAQNLYNLTPGQRRIIHLFLSNEKDIKTESMGEGEERYLVVSAVE